MNVWCRCRCGGVPLAIGVQTDMATPALARIGTGPFRHLCYPSGEYDRTAFPQLAELDVVSATTTLPGMNRTTTSPLELRRFLDSEACSAIRFEAEVSGFLELLRGLLGRSKDTQ